MESCLTANPYWEQVGPALTRGDAYDQYRSYWLRDEYCRLYAWAIPDPDSLAFVAQYGPLVEMGAGTGYWAAQLAALGVEIAAYDLAPPDEGENSFHDRARYFPVALGTPEALAGHSEATLLLCWPPEDDMAAQCLEYYHGQRLIYIGEGSGGYTANARFFALLFDGWELVAQHDGIHWPSVNDHIWVLERK